MGAYKLEPTLIIQGIVAALTVVQAAVIPGLPAWAHAVIAAATIGLGAIVNRTQVTPTAAIPYAPSADYAPAHGLAPDQ